MIINKCSICKSQLTTNIKGIFCNNLINPHFRWFQHSKVIHIYYDDWLFIQYLDTKNSYVHDHNHGLKFTLCMDIDYENFDIKQLETLAFYS